MYNRDVLFLDILLFVLEVAAIFFLLIPITHVISMLMSVPYITTRKQYISHITRELKITSNDIVYELGSGDGRILLACAKQYPTAEFVGIEYNPFLYLYAQLQKRLSGNPTNVCFLRESFFNTDLTQATRVYSYLLSSVMDALLPKFKRELKNVRLVSSAFKFSEKEPTQIVAMSPYKGLWGEHILYIYLFS